MRKVSANAVGKSPLRKQLNHFNSFLFSSTFSFYTHETQTIAATSSGCVHGGATELLKPPRTAYQQYNILKTTILIAFCTGRAVDEIV